MTAGGTGYLVYMVYIKKTPLGKKHGLMAEEGEQVKNEAPARKTPKEDKKEEKKDRQADLEARLRKDMKMQEDAKAQQQRANPRDRVGPENVSLKFLYLSRTQRCQRVSHVNLIIRYISILERKRAGKTVKETQELQDAKLLKIFVNPE